MTTVWLESLVKWRNYKKLPLVSAPKKSKSGHQIRYLVEFGFEKWSFPLLNDKVTPQFNWSEFSICFHEISYQRCTWLDPLVLDGFICSTDDKLTTIFSLFCRWSTYFRFWLESWQNWTWCLYRIWSKNPSSHLYKVEYAVNWCKTGQRVSAQGNQILKKVHLKLENYISNYEVQSVWLFNGLFIQSLEETFKCTTLVTNFGCLPWKLDYRDDTTMNETKIIMKTSCCILKWCIIFLLFLHLQVY